MSLIAACALLLTACIPDSGNHRNRYYGIDDDDYDPAYEDVEEVEVVDVAGDYNDYQRELNDAMNSFEAALNRLEYAMNGGRSESYMSPLVDRVNDTYQTMVDTYDYGKSATDQDERYNALGNRLDDIAQRYNNMYAVSDSTAYY